MVAISHEHTSNTTKAIFFIILSAFGLAFMSALIKMAGTRIPPLQKTLFRNGVIFLCSFVLVAKNNWAFLSSKKNIKLLLGRSAFGTTALICNIYAIDQLIISDASMLNRLSPFFTIILSSIFLKEKVNLRQCACVIVAFIGALFIIKPTFSSGIIPSMIGVLSGFTAGAAYTFVRAIGKKEKFYTIVFWFSTFSILVSLPFVIHSYVSMTSKELICLLLSGVGATINQFGITLAYSYAPPKKISIFDYTNIVFAALFSIILFGDVPDIYSFIGYLIIFASSLYMFNYNKKVDKCSVK